MALIDAMDQLLTCATEGSSPPVARAFLTSGLSVSWDECCEGQLWIRLVSQEATAPPKMGMAPQQPCTRTWLVTLGVGLLRCAANLNDRGEAPTPTAISNDARQVVLDKDALLDSVQCCLPAVDGVKSWALTRWDALGPDGGCVGGEWVLTMIVQTVDCAEPEPP